MESVKYVFRVDAFTPETLPMGRLADYMGALAKLLGHFEHTHFLWMEEGSAKVVHQVEAVDAPKVEQRLREVAAGGGPRDARKAFDLLDDLLAADNAVGHLAAYDGGRVLIPFPGRTRPRPLEFPSFWQDGSIDGQLVSIGGRDSTVHAILQDGDAVYSGLSLKRPLARILAPLLYGPKLRVSGRGRWERQPDGVWKLLEFRVEQHSVLEEKTLSEVLNSIRVLPGNKLMMTTAYREVRDIQNDGGAL